MSIVLEAAVESLDAALAAADGGADRLELCADLAHGGTTPPREFLVAAKSQLQIPVFVLIRPRAGDFVYTASEHGTMLGQIRVAKAAGADGIVTGELTNPGAAARGQPNLQRTRTLIAAARPLPVTFHRAFDECHDLGAALETLIDLGVERVLTSGGATAAAEGTQQIGQLMHQARGRITILPGGGINPDNVADLVRSTGAREVHFSVTSADKVLNVRRALNGVV